MKHSIRFRFAGTIFLIIGMVLSLIWLTNNFALKMFYINRKTNDMKSAYHQIDALVREAITSGENVVEYNENSQIQQKFSEIIKTYSNKNNITIAIIDPITKNALLTSERSGDLLLSRVQMAVEAVKSGNTADVQLLYQEENFAILKHYVNFKESTFLESFAYASDGQTIIVMCTPIESLQESVNLSNQFLAYIAVVSFGLSLILVVFSVRKITNPILELSELSEKMGALDFEAKYEGDSEDEIGRLGRNMNILSDKLKETIDELKLANVKLTEDIRKKEEIDEMRKDFIANVSHELKTPIALIQGYAEGLNEGLCNDEESRKYYTDIIIDEATKMNTMVKQLLTLSALESGMMELERNRFDIVDLISNILSTTSILLQEKNVEVTFDSSKEVYIYADEFKIEEVLTNFISNAMHHVSESGKICIYIEEVQDKHRISVFNTGKNIPEEDIKYLWEKFYKVDKAHSRSYGGTGIGLSIVKAVLEAYGASYGVENKKDGVEFWFEI